MSNSTGIESFPALKCQQSPRRSAVVGKTQKIVGDVRNYCSSHSVEEVQSDSHSLLTAVHKVGETDAGCVSSGSVDPQHNSLKNSNTGNTNLESKYASCIQINEPDYPVLESKSSQAHDKSMVIKVEPVDGNGELDCPENALERRGQCEGTKRTCEITDVENKAKYQKVGMKSNLPVDGDRSIGIDSTKYNIKQYASKRREKDYRSRGTKRPYETTDTEEQFKRVESKLKSTEVNLDSQCTGKEYAIMKNLLNTSSNVVRSLRNERQNEKVEERTKFVGIKDRSPPEEGEPESEIVAEHQRRVEVVDTLLQLQETLRRRDEPRNTVAVSESYAKCMLQRSNCSVANSNEINQHPLCEMSTNNERFGRRMCGVDPGPEKLTHNRNSISAFSICTPAYKGNLMNQSIVPSPENSARNTIMDPQGNYSKINQDLAYSLPNQPSRSTPIYMPASGSSQVISTCNIPIMDAIPLNMVLAEPARSTKLMCCDKCHTFFNSFIAIEAHNKTVHKYLTTCKVCYRGFKTSSNLERHNRIHQGKRDFKCFCCGREFSRKDHLTSHILTHPVKCPVCSQEFKERTSLASHCGVRHRLEVKFCNCCNETLPNNDEYEQHIRSHARSSTSSIRTQPNVNKLNNDSGETAEIAPVDDSDESMHKEKEIFKAQAVNASNKTNSRKVEGKTEVADTTTVSGSDEASNNQRAIIITGEVCRSFDKSQSEVKKYGEQEEQEKAFKDLSVVKSQDEVVDIVNCSVVSKLLNKGYDMATDRHRDLKETFSGISRHQMRNDMRYSVNHNIVKEIGENLGKKKKLKQKHPKIICRKDARASVNTFSCVSKSHDKPNCTKREKPRNMTKQVMRKSVASISSCRPVISVLGTIIESNHVTGLVNRNAVDLPVNRLDIATGIMGLPSPFTIEVGSQNSVIYPSSSYCKPLQSNRLCNMAHTTHYYSYCQGNHQNVNQGKILMTNPVRGLDHRYENPSQGGRDQEARRCRICNCVFSSDQLYAVHYFAYHCTCHLKA